MIPLAMITAAANICMAPAAPSHAKWLTGDFSVTPVVQPLQTAALKRLGSNSFIPVSASYADAVSTNKAVGAREKYYLIKVGWWSPAPRGTVPGNNVKMSVDVDNDRTAYVTSFLLTHSKKASDFAAILDSAIPIRRTVRICRAAE